MVWLSVSLNPGGCWLAHPAKSIAATTACNRNFMVIPLLSRVTASYGMSRTTFYQPWLHALGGAIGTPFLMPPHEHQRHYRMVWSLVNPLSLNVASSGETGKENVLLRAQAGNEMMDRLSEWYCKRRELSGRYASEAPSLNQSLLHRGNSAAQVVVAQSQIKTWT